MDMQQTISRPSRSIDTPPPIVTFRQSLLDLTGFDIENADSVAATMLDAMLLPHEALAILYQTVQNALYMSLARAKNRMGAEPDPLRIWREAAEIRTEATKAIAAQMAGLELHYKNRVAPTWSLPNPQAVRLNRGARYTLMNDSRNQAMVTVRSRGENILSVAPGQSVEVAQVDECEVVSEQPCLIAWARNGGSFRTGKLARVLPVSTASEQTIEPIKTVPKRKGWFW